MSSTQYAALVSCEIIIGFLVTVERNSCSVLSFLADLIRVGGASGYGPGRSWALLLEQLWQQQDCYYY
jgi:hypothetical protein